jgi:hypothetical protein
MKFFENRVLRSILVFVRVFKLSVKIGARMGNKKCTQLSTDMTGRELVRDEVQIGQYCYGS